MQTRTLGLLLLLAAAPAFAGRHESELAMTVAQEAVASAERAGAAEFASQDLERAQEALALAAGAFNARDWDDSLIAAERANLDARLAEARTRQLRAERTTGELEAALAALRAETSRREPQP